MQAESSDDWTSSIFSAYGITIMLVLLLIGLFVYKRISARKQAQAVPNLRGRTPAQSSDRNYPASARVQALEPSPLVERRQPPMEGVQVWEKPAEPELAVYGAYRIDQEVSKLIVGKPHRMDVM